MMDVLWIAVFVICPVVAGIALAEWQGGRQRRGKWYCPRCGRKAFAFTSRIGNAAWWECGQCRHREIDPLGERQRQALAAPIVIPKGGISAVKIVEDINVGQPSYVQYADEYDVIPI